MNLPDFRSNDFYDRPADQVARDLPGDLLLSGPDDDPAGGPIVETEAYLSRGDDANHALQSGKTERNQAMFGPPGTVYVYLIYGMYHCLNVVCREEGTPEAVLIRAIDPRLGVERMIARREENRSTGVPRDEIASGPGKLCMALDIDRTTNETSVNGDGPVSIRAGESVSDDWIATGSRVGVEYARNAGDWPLRFRVRNPDHVRDRSTGGFEET